MDEIFKVDLDGVTYYMPEPREGVIVAPLWSDARIARPDDIDRLNNKDGVWSKLSERESSWWNGPSAQSTDMQSMQAPLRFYLLSQEYLRIARLSCSDAMTEDTLTFERGCPALFCAHMAVELFLKAAIRSKSRDHKKIHGIPQLQAEYCRLFPEEYWFRTVWDFDLDAIERTFDVHVGNRLDRKPDQVYRYFSGQGDEIPSGISVFSPGLWLFTLEHLSRRWEEIWQSIQADIAQDAINSEESSESSR